MRMALPKPMLAVIFLVLLFEKYSEGGDSSSNNNEDTSSIPVIASGKRQHNIMRFGKRPAGGHKLFHFGKREDTKSPQHSFLYFGKRNDDQESLPDLIQYLQKTRDNSYKRGHTIMRFGKRAPGSHSFIRFGRGDGEDDYDSYYSPDDGEIDEAKRGGHNMMYFGKRGGHSMLYFGKRAPGHSILSFGKRDDDKRAHSMIHFGKREDEDEDDMSLEEKRAHAMIHFGKREEDDDLYPEEYKRAAHSMIHFGKREFDDESLPYWNPNTYEKKQHNLLRFGKKMDGMRKGSHAMIHFGKRSVDQSIESTANNESASAPNQPLTRMKRDLEEPTGNPEPLVALIRYGNNEEDVASPDEVLENAIKSSQANMYPTREMMDEIAYPYTDDEQNFLPIYSDYQPAHKKDASKNVFLRFG